MSSLSDVYQDCSNYSELSINKANKEWGHFFSCIRRDNWKKNTAKIKSNLALTCMALGWPSTEETFLLCTKKNVSTDSYYYSLNPVFSSNMLNNGSLNLQVFAVWFFLPGSNYLCFRLSAWGQKFLLLLVSPLTLLYVAAFISSLNEKYADYLELLMNSWSTLSRGLLLAMVDRYFFGSWLFGLFSFTVLPNWLTLWGISFCEEVWWCFSFNPWSANHNKSHLFLSSAEII